MTTLIHGDITDKIWSAALEVHRNLGPGLLESAYKVALMKELTERNLGFRVEVPIPMLYKGERLDCGYRADFLVEGKILIELKAAEHIHNLFKAQLMTYLKLSRHKVGLLINFNCELLKQGVIRIVL